jgi:hypothetical protein
VIAAGLTAHVVAIFRPRVPRGGESRGLIRRQASQVERLAANDHPKLVPGKLTREPQNIGGCSRKPDDGAECVIGSHGIIISRLAVLIRCEMNRVWIKQACSTRRGFFKANRKSRWER